MDWAQLLKDLADAVELRNRRVASERKDDQERDKAWITLR